MTVALWLTLAFAVAPPPEGTLYVVGGGSMPDAVRRSFVDRAGGKAARIVVIPTASGDAGRAGAEGSFLDPWRKLSPASVELVHVGTKSPEALEAAAAKIRAATAVWMSGGDQSRLTAAYRGTPVEAAMRGLLWRGGVVGGTSAGAAVMSETMITGGRKEPTLAPGFGFVTGVIVDQHFLARDRLDRLLDAMRRTPGTSGMGIDESTAAVVTGRTMVVEGRSFVVICRAGGKGFRVMKPGDAGRVE